MKKLLMASALVLGVGIGQAQAVPVVVASVGGAPTPQPGLTLNNLDFLPLGGAGGTSGLLTVSFVNNGQTVNGSVANTYAAPVLSNGNGAGFGSPNQPDGVDTTDYVTSGSFGSVAGAQVEFSWSALQQYFGLLWGSVDTYNTLTFFNGATQVMQFTGADIDGLASGNQGPAGTFYVNITNTDPTVEWNRVVATSSQFAFEIDNVAFSENVPVIPEPASMFLLGTGLVGLAGAARRRRARKQ